MHSVYRHAKFWHGPTIFFPKGLVEPEPQAPGPGPGVFVGAAAHFTSHAVWLLISDPHSERGQQSEKIHFRFSEIPPTQNCTHPVAETKSSTLILKMLDIPEGMHRHFPFFLELETNSDKCVASDASEINPSDSRHNTNTQLDESCLCHESDDRISIAATTKVVKGSETTQTTKISKEVS